MNSVYNDGGKPGAAAGLETEDQCAAMPDFLLSETQQPMFAVGSVCARYCQGAWVPQSREEADRRRQWPALVELNIL